MNDACQIQIGGFLVDWQHWRHCRTRSVDVRLRTHRVDTVVNLTALAHNQISGV
jgi:hypothetical protein